PPTSTLFPYTTLFRSRLREDARRRGPDVEHADECVTRAQRHPDQRAHALAQERTHDLDVGEVVEDQAARALRDGPGHAGAQRNADRKSTRLNSSHVAI